MQKVFITGGSSGIGKQLAADYLKRGDHVTIVANNPVKLEEAQRDLTAIKALVFSFVCDVAELDQVRSVSAAYVEKFGAPDIVVSNAGFAVYRTFEQMTAEEIARLLNVNFVGACLVIREFLPHMLKNGSGNIVVMASIAGRLVMTPCGVYSAAKHGLVALAHTLQLELSHTNVNVHVICPGRVETDFFADESFKTRAPRKETQHTIPIEAVSQAVFQGNRKQAIYHIRPQNLRPAGVAYQCIPLPGGDVAGPADAVALAGCRQMIECKICKHTRAREYCQKETAHYYLCPDCG